MTKRKDSETLTTIEFARAIDQAIHEYNAKLHRSIRQTPLSAWHETAGEIVPVAERDVALALLRREPVNVDSHGRVELNGVEYIGKGSIAHRGEPLEVGWLATRPEMVELFRPTERGYGEYLGRCTPLDEASGKLAGLVEQVRDREITTVRAADARAEELRKELRLQRDPVDGSANDSPPKHQRSRTTSAAASDSGRRRRLSDAGTFKPRPEG